jgi:PAS domain S-box-containing protein
MDRGTSGVDPEEAAPTANGSSGAGDAPLDVILDAAGVALCEWDPATCSLRWGGRDLHLGPLPQRFDPDQPQSWGQVEPEQREPLRRSVQHTLDSGEPYSAEFRVRARDGTLRHIEARVRSLPGALGTRPRLIVILRDLTEERRAQASLRDQAAILADVHDAVIATTLNGIVTTWNRAAERLYGYSADEAIGRSIELLYFPADVPMLEEHVLAPTRRAGKHDIILRNRRKDGAEIIVALRMSLLCDEAQNPLGFISCSNDVTVHRAEQRSLRRQHDELQMILDSVPAFIWYKNRDNQILRANRLAAESMGTTVEALAGKSTYELYPEEASAYHQDDLAVIRSGRARVGIIEPLRTAGGEKRWVRTDKVPYRDASGEIVGVIVFSVDVTDRIHAEEELRRAHDLLEKRVAERTQELAAALEVLRAETADRLRAEETAREHQSQLAHLLRLRTVEGMAAQLAHEINQPLSAIVNFAGGLTHWFAGESKDKVDAQWVAEEIRNQALRAAEIIRRLREFVRNQEPRRVRCNLAPVIREALHLVETEARNQHIALHLQLQPDLPSLEFDRIQIQQVVLNLLRNAVEALDATREEIRAITIETTIRDDDYVLVRVSDTGKGLPSASNDWLFEPFFTTKPDGLGMGLSISKSIIAAHGGDLWAEPNGERGTTFAFTLRRSG